MTIDERYETYQQGGKYFVPIDQAIPGWRYMPIRADGTFDIDPDTLEAPMAFCSVWELQRSLMTAGERADAPLHLVAIAHDSNCTCGYRQTDSLETLRDYIRQESEKWDIDDPIGYEKSGYAGIAIVQVAGHGTATFRDTHDPEPAGVLRSTNFRATGTVYIPHDWSHTEIPDSLAEAVAAQYPTLTVERIPSLYEPPGIPPRTAPVPNVEAHHPTTRRWGREGAASALIRANGKFLVLFSMTARLEQQRMKWEAPGGARGRREDYIEAALRETEEETGYRPTVFETVGEVHFEDRGWHHHSFAIDARRVSNTELPDLLRTLNAPTWMPREALQGAARLGYLMPDFKRDLPQLLAAFDRHDKENTQ